MVFKQRRCRFRIKAKQARNALCYTNLLHAGVVLVDTDRKIGLIQDIGDLLRVSQQRADQFIDMGAEFRKLLTAGNVYRAVQCALADIRKPFVHFGNTAYDETVDIRRYGSYQQDCRNEQCQNQECGIPGEVLIHRFRSDDIDDGPVFHSRRNGIA